MLPSVLKGSWLSMKLAASFEEEGGNSKQQQRPLAVLAGARWTDRCEAYHSGYGLNHIWLAAEDR